MFLEEHFPSIPQELSSASLIGLGKLLVWEAELYVQGVARSYDPSCLCFLLLNII